MTDEAVEALQQALDYIVDHPEEWDQKRWITYINANGGKRTSGQASVIQGCQTAACLAGRIAIQSPEITHEIDYFGYVDGDAVRYKGREETVWDAVSLLLLGKTYDHDLYPLFHGDNTLSNLFYEAERLSHGRIRVPEGIRPCRRWEM